MIQKQTCLICKGNECTLGYDLDVCNNYQFYDCPQCGKYIFGGDKFRNTDYFPYFGSEKNDTCILSTDKLQSYTFYHKSDRYFLLGNKEIFDEYSERKFKYAVKNVTKEEIENWYPKTFADRTDRILLYLYGLEQYEGEQITLNYSDLVNIFLIKKEKVISDKDSVSKEHYNQIKYIIEYFSKLNLVEFSGSAYTGALTYHHKLSFTITPIGLAHIYDLQKNQTKNKNVFVAMSFHESANDIRQAIKKGIDNAQYSSLLMDEIVHNHQIVPEMLRLIKESRFMIMDITQPNFGAYYEAGYAQGLGKEVIVTCSQEVWDKKDFSCDKDKNCVYKQISTKPHFDIAQKQVLVWKDYADLSKKLSEWIKHLIG